MEAASVEFIQIAAAHVELALINMITCHRDGSFISRVLFGSMVKRAVLVSEARSDIIIDRGGVAMQFSA